MTIAEIPLDAEAPVIAVASCGCFVFSVLITVYHLFNVRKHIGSKAFKWEYLKDNLTIFVSYVLLIAGIIVGINFALGVAIGLHSAAFCNYQKHVGPASYVIFKTILYLLLICRTWQVFKSSILAYDAKKLIIYAFILILWTTINVFINSFGVVLKVNDKYPRCLIFVPPAFLVSSILCDLISGIISIILFVKPIILLSKITDFDVEIRNCAYHQTILATIAIISTMLMLTLIGLFNAPKLFSSLDVVISTLSIIFMNKWHTNFIAKIFFCCIHPQQVNDLKNLEIVNNTNNTQTRKKNQDDSANMTVTVASTNTAETETATVASTNTVETETV